MVNGIKGTRMKSKMINDKTTCCSVVNGKIPIVHLFIDENERSVSINGSCYLKLLQDTVWPALRSTATRKLLVDETVSHLTAPMISRNSCSTSFKIVISRGTSIIWPVHSADLNLLNFHFWGEAQRKGLSASGGHKRLY